MKGQLFLICFYFFAHMFSIKDPANYENLLENTIGIKIHETYSEFLKYPKHIESLNGQKDWFKN